MSIQHLSADTIAVVIAAVFFLLERLGLLERIGLKRRGLSDVEAELAIADRSLNRITAERDRALAAIKDLERTHSLEPVLELLHKNIELQAQVTRMLVNHDRAFEQIEEHMGLITQSLQMISGFVAELHDLPVRPTRRRTA